MINSKVQWCPTVYVISIDICAMLYQKFSNLLVPWKVEEWNGLCFWTIDSGESVELWFYHSEQLNEAVSNSGYLQHWHSPRAVSKVQQFFGDLIKKNIFAWTTLEKFYLGKFWNPNFLLPLHSNQVNFLRRRLKKWISFKYYLVQRLNKAVFLLQNLLYQRICLYSKTIPPNAHGLNWKMVTIWQD